MEDTSDFKRRASQNIFIIRGFAIFLVVLGHVIGDRDSGIRQLYEKDLLGLAQLFTFIYTFHMPIFFLASGFSLVVFTKSSPRLFDFIKSRALRILVPLLCWAPIYYIFRSAMGRVDFRAFGIIASVIHPDFIFWFFPAMFFASVLGFFFLIFLQSWLLYIVTSLILFILSFYLTGNLATWFYFNSFYFLGCLLGLYLLKKDQEIKPLSGWKAILIASIMVSLMLFTYFLLDSKHLSSLSVKFINGVLGFCILYILINSSSQSPLPDCTEPISKMNKGILFYLGQISMSVYLLHVMCGSAMRNVLARFGILEPSIQFTLGLLASVIGPVLIYRILSRNRLFLYSIGETK